MYILGVNLSIHDSAACLLHDGSLIAAAEEERFSRVKHTGEFPYGAIAYCLKEANISLRDVSYVAYSQVPWHAWPEKIGYFLSGFPASVTFLKKEIYWYLLNWGKLNTWWQRFDLSYEEKKFKEVFVRHHIAHAASAAFVSPFEEASVFSIDQRGEWITTLYGIYKDNKISVLKSIDFPHSIGLFYLMMTLYLGFDYHDEYLTMGLSSYGKPIYKDKMKSIIHCKGNGSFRFNTQYLSSHYKKMYSDALIRLFGPAREKDEPLKQRHYDIAASAQALTEEIVFSLLNYLFEQTKMTNLCLAGGVGLNCALNGKIQQHTPFKDIFVQPAATDDGTCVGAAFYVYNMLLKKDKCYIMQDAYLGPQFSNEEIETKLKLYNLKYSLEDNIEQKSAHLLAAGKVIGWFQGRMEFGPRALGSRSILADPRTPQIKDKINLVVKERHPFRPFAPAVLQEDAPDYFDLPFRSPFMMFVCKVRPEKRDKIPAVVHIDGSSRVQTVSSITNPRFYNLINEFKKITNVGVILNTSFNVRGEPIVCTPKDAIRCFYTSGLDALAINDFLIQKS